MPGQIYPFLGNRITTTFDYFVSRTDNMLIFRPVEAYLGYYTRMENAGQLKNKGWEFNTFFRVMDRVSFKWDVQASVSQVKNEVTEIEGEKLVTDIIGAQIVNQLGSPANSFYGYIYKGVYSTQEEARRCKSDQYKKYEFYGR